jgi:hypothetical protein
MSNVVQFKKPEEPPVYRWKCECGCWTFHLNSNHTMTCANCSKLTDANGLVGNYVEIPEITKSVIKKPEDEKSLIRVVEYDDRNEAARRNLEDALAEDNLSYLIFIKSNGSLYVHGTYDNEPRKVWLRRKLADVMRIANGIR